MRIRGSLLFPVVGALVGVLIGSFFASLHSPVGLQGESAGVGDSLLSSIARREWNSGDLESAMQTLVSIDDPFQRLHTLDTLLFPSQHANSLVSPYSLTQNAMTMGQSKIPELEFSEDVVEVVTVFLAQQKASLAERKKGYTIALSSVDYRDLAELYLYLEKFYRVVVRDEEEALEVFGLAKSYAQKSTELGLAEEDEYYAKQDEELSIWLKYPLVFGILCFVLSCLVKPTLNEVGNGIRDGILASRISDDEKDSIKSVTGKSTHGVEDVKPLVLETPKPK